MERTVYDDEGQLLTGSYMDYALPRALDAPIFDVANHPVPATTNPLGVKGCGEAGCAGSLTSIMNAVVDALSDYGIRHIDMPATPHRVWQAIRAAGGRAASLQNDETNKRRCPRPSNCRSAPRAAETKFVGSVCFGHFVSHYYILLLAPVFLFVRDDYGVTYTDLASPSPLSTSSRPCCRRRPGSWWTA